MGTPTMSITGLFTLCLVLTLCVCDDINSNNECFKSKKSKPLPPDNRFEIEVVDVVDKYIPNKEYEVRLFSRDNVTTFTAFTIFLVPAQRLHEKNELRTYYLDPGKLLSSRNREASKATVAGNMCLYQSDIQPKTSVQARWMAPPKGNNCVTIKAFLAIQPDLWYDAESPLAKKICEDVRKADDMQPKINHNCTICEEARYELTFEGTWSFNTHPKMFPNSTDLAKFSDIVGASHGKDYSVFKDNTDAGLGLQMMAEQGNTTELEVEILKKLIDGNVRTLIKATAPPKTDMSTVTSFRVNNKMHLVSIVTSIIPSPDWFLGVANLEVCNADTGAWAKSVRLNLYPFDAGTDSGKDFESPNEATLPHQPITIADLTKRIQNEEDLKPFAILKVELVRTYFTPNCLTDTEEPTYGNTEEGPETPEPPTIVGETPPTATDTDENTCEMTEWTEWSSCEGECVDNVLSGTRARYRSFQASTIPQECLNERTSDFEECEEPCEETTTTTEVPATEDDEAEKRRRWRQQLMSTSLN